MLCILQLLTRNREVTFVYKIIHWMPWFSFSICRMCQIPFGVTGAHPVWRKWDTPWTGCQSVAGPRYHSHTHLSTSINLWSIFLDCGRKSQCSEKPIRKKMETRAFLKWGRTTNYYAAPCSPLSAVFISCDSCHRLYFDQKGKVKMLCQSIPPSLHLPPLIRYQVTGAAV